ncbi:protein of unknown function (plasmid) [Caballeronia sp. S22]
MFGLRYMIRYACFLAYVYVLKETYSIEQVLPAYERVGEAQRDVEN